jgi:hypothetical protein
MLDFYTVLGLCSGLVLLVCIPLSLIVKRKDISELEPLDNNDLVDRHPNIALPPPPIPARSYTSKVETCNVHKVTEKDDSLDFLLTAAIVATALSDDASSSISDSTNIESPTFDGGDFGGGGSTGDF